MSAKHLGKCPFCKKMMRPNVIEENIIRRDQCACTECGEYIYVCRNPGCEDYAKGGSFYDDELCPSCTNAAPAVAMSVLPVIAGLFGSKKK